MRERNAPFACTFIPGRARTDRPRPDDLSATDRLSELDRQSPRHHRARLAIASIPPLVMAPRFLQFLDENHGS